MRRAGIVGRGRNSRLFRREVAVLLHVARLISKALGSSKRIDKALRFDCLQTRLESFVQEFFAGLGQDAVSKLVQLGGGHLVDELLFCGSNHGFAKVAYAPFDGRRRGMMDGGVQLGGSQLAAALYESVNAIAARRNGTYHEGLVEI